MELAVSGILVLGVLEVNHISLKVSSPAPIEGGCNKVYIGNQKNSWRMYKRTPGKIASNLSAVGEHYQNTGWEPNLDYMKVLCREDKLFPCKVREAL